MPGTANEFFSRKLAFFGALIFVKERLQQHISELFSSRLVFCARASCLHGRFAPLLVMESGLPDGACMLWISIP